MTAEKKEKAVESEALIPEITSGTALERIEKAVDEEDASDEDLPPKRTAIEVYPLADHA